MKIKNLAFYIILGLAIIFALTFFVIGNLPNQTSQLAVPQETVKLENGDTYELIASNVIKEINGDKYKMLAYNGSIPGPSFEVLQGSEITINFVNKTDGPQLLHSHGVRMENKFDGSQAVQKEMLPGESFSYKLKFPDVGIYWYHPHVDEVYNQALGLYGAFVVKPNKADYFPKVNRELPLFLSDLPIRNNKIDIEEKDATHTLMGHYGNTMLINGESDFNLEAKTGETIRLYLVNVANTRPFNFAIDGLQLKLIGGDSGAYETQSFVDNVILGPSERAIVDVLFEQNGNYDIQNQTPETTYNIGTVNVINQPVESSYAQGFSSLNSNQDTISGIDPFRAYFDAAPAKSLSLSIDFSGGMMSMQGMEHGAHSEGMMMGGSNDGIEWDDTNQIMNAMSNTDSVKWKIIDTETGKENMDINWILKKDQPIKIRIFNDKNSMHPMQHPIHFHGQRFLVVARDGIKQNNLVWKDTALIKTGETVDIILDTSNPGQWMAHCHISEHLEGGMMFNFEVQ